MIGALTLVALIISFMLAIRARDQGDVALVIVVPAGTELRIEGARPRALPEQPDMQAGLTSFYFMTRPGEHDVVFREPGKSERTQSIEVPQENAPVIYTLLHDSLRRMQAR